MDEQFNTLKRNARELFRALKGYPRADELEAWKKIYEAAKACEARSSYKASSIILHSVASFDSSVIVARNFFALAGHPCFPLTAISSPGALYEAFAPAEARRILRRLEFHCTPKHASWACQVHALAGAGVAAQAAA